MNWLTAIFNAVTEFMRWKNSPWRQARVDAAEVRKAEEKREQERADLHKAVTGGDEDAVNARLAKIRGHKAVAVAWLLAISALTGAGCATSTKVVYVPESDRAVRMKLGERPGWWIPDSVFFDLVNRAESAKTGESQWPDRASPRVN